jgi:hypothetical protein
VKYDELMGTINDAHILCRNSSSEYLLHKLRKYLQQTCSADVDGMNKMIIT